MGGGEQVLVKLCEADGVFSDAAEAERGLHVLNPYLPGAQPERVSHTHRCTMRGRKRERMACMCSTLTSQVHSRRCPRAAGTSYT